MLSPDFEHTSAFLTLGGLLVLAGVVTWTSRRAATRRFLLRRSASGPQHAAQSGGDGWFTYEWGIGDAADCGADGGGGDGGGCD